MTPHATTAVVPLDREKFRDPDVTATGETRAFVALTRLRTLWINTGSLCNLTCVNCYIESSPTNDRLAYVSADEVRTYLDEIAEHGLAVREVGFTGGEPFMNRELPAMLAECLTRGFRVLVLTNAMKPMAHKRAPLLSLRDRHGDALKLRVSLDHYARERHEALRGPDTWEPTIEGLRWLVTNGFHVDVAGRSLRRESDRDQRAGFAALFAALGIPVDADDPESLVLFPEMSAATDVPEITVRCWQILGVSPDAMMCASSRMVIKRKGATQPTVVPCTLLPYDPQFELGTRLLDAHRAVRLNHPFCAQFCVLGGSSCSARE